jgi:hypothetical protein
LGTAMLTVLGKTAAAAVHQVRSAVMSTVVESK